MKTKAKGGVIPAKLSLITPDHPEWEKYKKEAEQRNHTPDKEKESNNEESNTK